MCINIKEKGGGWVLFSDGMKLKSNGDLNVEPYDMYINCHYEVWKKPKPHFRGNLKIDNLYTLNVTDVVRDELIKHFTPRPTDVLLEVGAYHGWGTIKMAQYVKHVHAIEADTENFLTVVDNLLSNGVLNVQAYPIALGSFCGTGRLYEGRRGYARSLKRESLVKVKGAEGVPVRRGDDLFKDITYITLEINKGELDALEGMRNILKADNLRIISAGWYDNICYDIKDLLEPLGYSVFIGKVKRVYALKL